MDGELISSLCSVIFVILLISLSAKRKARGKTSASAKPERTKKPDLSGKIHGGEHTHDRLDFDCVNMHETEAEHYRKQLDSFLAAGLIDRAERNELLRRYEMRK